MHQSKQAGHAQQRGGARATRKTDHPSPAGDQKAGILTLQQAAGNRAASQAIKDRTSPAPGKLPGNLPPEVARAVRGPGQPLDASTAAEMTGRFGQDFSHVRLHTSASAGASARALHARAYTVGPDIVFGPGRYIPGSAASDGLLTHELAHVVQQSRGGSQAPSHAQYRRAEGEANAAASHSGPASVAQAVALGTVQAQEEESALGSAGSWILGALGGEFTDDPTYGQIGVDFVLSIIPYVDQAADARDLTAHIYRLGFRGEHTHLLRWIGLVFTLIGLVPELGSAIKSASRAVIRFVGRNVDTIFRFVRRLADLLPEAVGGLRGVRRLIVEHWDDWARFGRGVWDTLLARGGALIDAIVARLNQIRAIPGFLLTRGKQFLVSRLDRLRRLSAAKLPEVAQQIKDRVLAAMDDLAERMGIGPRTAPAGGPNIPGRSEPLQMSGSGGGAGSRTTTTTVDELMGRSGTTSEAIDELEGTVTRGSRTQDPSELGYLAEAGRRIEPGEVARWAERLGPGWRVTVRAQWDQWMRRLFPRGGPDMIAVNAQRRHVIVGDIAPSPRSRVDVRAGTGAGPPARQRGGPGSETTRAGDEGTRPHLEKTIEDAQRVAQHLPAELRGYKVFAQEWYWEHGQQLSRLIPISP